MDGKKILLFYLESYFKLASWPIQANNCLVSKLSARNSWEPKPYALDFI